MLLFSVISGFSALVTPQHEPGSSSLTCALDEGTTATTINSNSTGRVIIHGVYWKAKTTKELPGITIQAGKPVTVDYRKGLTLYVRPIN